MTSMSVGFHNSTSMGADVPNRGMPLSRPDPELVKLKRDKKSSRREAFKRGWHNFSTFAFRKKMLVVWTLAGVVCGIALGAGLYGVHPSPGAVELIGYPGELMITALQELVLPLIAFALAVGVLNLRHTTSGTGRITAWSLLYYLMSMVFAVGIAIALAYIIKPGHSHPFVAQSPAEAACQAKNSNTLSSASSTAGNTTSTTPAANGQTVESILNIGRSLVPKNIVMAAATAQYLGVIMFAIVFAACLNSLGPRAEPLCQIIELGNDVIMLMIYLVIYCTPIGIASLIAKTILSACAITHLLKALALYLCTVLAGFAIHGLIVLPLIVLLLGRVNPVKCMHAYFPAFAMGFGTSSSAATMPVTMQCGENFGSRRSIVKFVIPLGTNINRDGAALYEAASVLFLAQANSVTLSAGNVVVVCFVSVLAAIGSASIPNSALVSMITVLQAVGMAQFIPNLSLLFALDWLIGMFRTVLNIWGDASAVTCVNTWAIKYEAKGLLDEEALTKGPSKAFTKGHAMPEDDDSARNEGKFAKQLYQPSMEDGLNGADPKLSSDVEQGRVTQYIARLSKASASRGPSV